MRRAPPHSQTPAARTHLPANPSATPSLPPSHTPRGRSDHASASSPAEAKDATEDKNVSEAASGEVTPAHLKAKDMAMAAAAAICGAAFAAKMWSLLILTHKFTEHTSVGDKLSSLVSEEAFYYSFYNDVVEAPSFGAGLHRLTHDSMTEYPDTINSLSRFNIWPEVILAAMYRSCDSLYGGECPIERLEFALGGVVALSGVHLTLLLVIAYEAGGRSTLAALGMGVWYYGGLSLSTRIWLLPEEREHYALPFLSLRVLFLSRALREAERGVAAAAAGWSCNRALTMLGTVVFMTFW